MVCHLNRRRGRHPAILIWALLSAWAVGGRAAAAEPLHVTIDRLVEESLVAPPAPLAGDAEFLRRISLDLTNRIASTSDLRSFLRDTSPEKRRVLVESLLASPQHARRLANFLDVTLMERRRDKYVGRPEWENWLYQACLENRPWDQIVRELLTADGVDPARRAPAKFCLEREADPNLLTRDAGRVLFGRDIQCAQCHNHPNVKDYEQREYYGLFSFFQRTGLQKQPNGVYVVAEKAEGDPTFESVFAKGTTHAARPALPGGEGQANAAAPGSRRELLANSITAGNNRAFNRNIVNRLWAMMMGRGLVQPVDFDHSDNPPSHPELLDRLADEIAAMKYDMRAFLKEIALSNTYQRAFDLPADFDRESAETVGQIPALETAAEAAKKAFDSASAELKAARKEALAAREAIDKPLKELRTQEVELSKLRKALAPVAAALAESRRQLHAKTSANAAVVKALDLARQASAIVPADADLKAVVDKLQAKSAQFGNEIQAVTKAIANQSDAVKQATDKVQTAEKVVADAAAKMQQADDAARPALDKYAHACRTHEQAKAALAASERRLETAKAVAEYRVKAQSLAGIEEKVGAIDRVVAAARRLRDEANIRQDSHRRELAALERQCDGLRESAAAAAEVLKQRQQATDALAVAAESVEKAGALVKDDELSRAAMAIRKRGSALAEATAAARKQLSEREAEHQAARSRCDKLRSEAPAVEQAAAAAKSRTAELEAKHQSPLAQLATARKEQAAARQAVLERLAESYAVAPLRPLTPEQMHWSIFQATGILGSYETTAEAALNKKQPPPQATERAIAREKDVHAKLAANLTPFVHLYGGGPGQPQFEFFATADQALFMENSDAIRAWTAPGVTLVQRLAKQTQPAAFAEELYLSVLNRPPTPDETAEVANVLARRPGPTPAAAGELAWALLASVEFRFNH
jgi:hypothetical protein